jgi:hypothetical protein
VLQCTAQSGFHRSAKALAQLLVEGRRFGEPLRLVLEGIGIAGPGAAEPLGQNWSGRLVSWAAAVSASWLREEGYAVMQIIVHALLPCADGQPLVASDVR